MIRADLLLVRQGLSRWTRDRISTREMRNEPVKRFCFRFSPDHGNTVNTLHARSFDLASLIPAKLLKAGDYFPLESKRGIVRRLFLDDWTRKIRVTDLMRFRSFVRFFLNNSFDETRVILELESREILKYDLFVCTGPNLRQTYIRSTNKSRSYNKKRKEKKIPPRCINHHSFNAKCHTTIITDI